MLPQGGGEAGALIRAFDWTGRQRRRGTGPGFARLAMELAGLPGHPARKIAHHHKASRERQLAEALVQQGAHDSAGLAREIWLLLEGAMALALIRGDKAYVEAEASAARKLMKQSGPSPGRRDRPAASIARRRGASGPKVWIGR